MDPIELILQLTSPRDVPTSAYTSGGKVDVAKILNDALGSSNEDIDSGSLDSIKGLPISEGVAAIVAELNSLGEAQVAAIERQISGFSEAFRKIRQDPTGVSKAAIRAKAEAANKRDMERESANEFIERDDEVVKHVMDAYDDAIDTLQKDRGKIDSKRRGLSRSGIDRVARDIRGDEGKLQRVDSDIEKLEKLIKDVRSNFPGFDKRDVEDVRKQNDDIIDAFEDADFEDFDVLNKLLAQRSNLDGVRDFLKTGLSDFKNRKRELDSNLSSLSDKKVDLEEKFSSENDAFKEQMVRFDERLDASPNPNTASSDELISWMVGSPSDPSDLVFVDKLEKFGEGVPDSVRRVVAQKVDTAVDNEINRNFVKSGPQADRQQEIQRFQNRRITETDVEQDIKQDVSPTMAELDSATLEEEKIATGEFDFLESAIGKEEEIISTDPEVDAAAFDQFGAPQSTTEEVVTTYAPNAGPNSGTLDGLLPVEEEIVPISAVSDPIIKEEQVTLNVERESRGLPLLNPDGVEGPATIAARELAANDYVAAAINGENDNLPNDELNAEATALIIENFGSTSFFKNKKSMEIDDPRNPGTTINVVDYIEEEGLTNEEEILGFISQTTWFQTNGVTARKFQQDWEIAGDAGRAEMLDSTSDSIKREALKIGLNLSADQLYELAYNAKSVGMDDYEIRAELVDNYEISFDSKKMQSGAIANLKSQIHQRAAKYMMPLDNAAVSAAAQEIYLGNSTLDGLEAGFRNQAIGSMPAIGKLIEAGYTPEMYFSSYKDQAESLLERNVDFLGTDRQMFINIMGGQSSDEFIQKPLTLGQTNKYVRSLDEWNYTDNARQDARGMAEQIAKTFGAVA